MCASYVHGKTAPEMMAQANAPRIQSLLCDDLAKEKISAMDAIFRCLAFSSSRVGLLLLLFMLLFPREWFRVFFVCVPGRSVDYNSVGFQISPFATNTKTGFKKLDHKVVQHRQG
jgi:hypothetical protein